MANARAIVKRRKAVQNIRKITRTMQLIATARYQVAYKRALATRPYTDKITELVEQLSRGAEGIEHPLLKVNTEAKRSAMIAITSNRGMCGGYNAALLRACVQQLEANENAGDETDLHMVGKKGITYFKFLGRELSSVATHFEDKPQFAEVEQIATSMMDAYERGQLDRVQVVYTKFISVSNQRVETLQLLPIERPEREETAAGGEMGVQYEFTPPAEELLAELLPETVKVRLFQCFVDAAVSEQVARMVAMKAATDAAGDMVKALTQQYNRARQSQITLELLDIVGGAEALQA
jgi:F-type H+-transporting ATPase subunit gamma